jgi:peroxidase
MQATSTPSDNQELVSKIKSQIESAFQSGRMKFQSMQDTEDRLVTNNIVVLAGSSSALNSLVFHTTHESQKINHGALIDVYTAEDIVNRYLFKSNIFQLIHFNSLVLNRFGVKPNDVDSVLNQFKGQCPPPPSCRHNKDSPYRTMDGSCNNIKRSTWGQSRTQFQRILFPVYSDGIKQFN